MNTRRAYLRPRLKTKIRTFTHTKTLAFYQYAWNTKLKVRSKTKPRVRQTNMRLFFSSGSVFFLSFVRFPNYIHADWYECDNEQIWVRIFLCGSSNANEAPCGLSEFAWVFKNRLDEGRKKDSIVDLKLFCWEFQCRGYWDLNHFNEELDVSIGEPYHRSIKYIVIWNEERKRESTQIYQMQNDAGRKKLSFTVYVCIIINVELKFRCECKSLAMACDYGYVELVLIYKVAPTK